MTTPATAEQVEAAWSDTKLGQVLYHDWEAQTYDDKWSISFDARCIDSARDRFSGGGRHLRLTRGKPGKTPVRIGPGSWIGTKATVLRGTVVGRNCVLAAHAVIRGRFPDYSVVAGVPAGWCASARPMPVHMEAIRTNRLNGGEVTQESGIIAVPERGVIRWLSTSQAATQSRHRARPQSTALTRRPLPHLPAPGQLRRALVRRPPPTATLPQLLPPKTSRSLPRLPPPPPPPPPATQRLAVPRQPRSRPIERSRSRRPTSR